MTRLRLLRFRLWHQMLTYIAPGTHAATHTATHTHTPNKGPSKSVSCCSQEDWPMAARGRESERCLCLCVYHMLHCLLVILASQEQSCSAAFGRRAQAEGKQMSLCRACRSSPRLVSLGTGSSGKRWGRSEVTSANARFLSRSLHPSLCCRLYFSVSLFLSRSTLSWRRPYATHATAAPKGRQYFCVPYSAHDVTNERQQ